MARAEEAAEAAEGMAGARLTIPVDIVATEDGSDIELAAAVDDADMVIVMSTVVVRVTQSVSIPSSFSATAEEGAAVVEDAGAEDESDGEGAEEDDGMSDPELDWAAAELAGASEIEVEEASSAADEAEERAGGIVAEDMEAEAVDAMLESALDCAMAVLAGALDDEAEAEGACEMIPVGIGPSNVMVVWDKMGSAPVI